MLNFPREFYIVTIMATMIFIASTIISPFFSLYLDEEGASPVEVGLIISLMSYTTLFTRIPLGMVTSRIGIWWVVPLALIGQSSSYILYSLEGNIARFYLIRVFHAVALASLHPTLMLLASLISPEDKRGEAIGIYLTSIGLAMMGGPLLCSFLLSHFNYRRILLLSSIIPLVAFIVYFFLLKSETLNQHLSKAKRREKPSKLPWSSLKDIVTLKSVQSLTYIRFTFAFTMSIITTIYAIYAVKTLQIDPSIYALLITLRGLANTLARIPAGRISDAIGRKKPLLTSFILLTAVFFLLSEVKQSTTIGIIMFLYGIAHGIRAVSEWSLLADVVPESSRSLANFYFSSVFDLGAALGATFAGSAAMIMSSPMILRIAGVLISSSIFIVAFTKVSQKK